MDNQIPRNRVGRRMGCRLGRRRRVLLLMAGDRPRYFTSAGLAEVGAQPGVEEDVTVVCALRILSWLRTPGVLVQGLSVGQGGDEELMYVAGQASARASALSRLGLPCIADARRPSQKTSGCRRQRIRPRYSKVGRFTASRLLPAVHYLPV